MLFRTMKKGGIGKPQRKVEKITEVHRYML